MAMGQTGTINCTPEMLTSALSAIDTYRETTTSLHEKLTGEVTGLIPGSFSGSAAEGFNYFFTNQIEPAVGQSLTGLLDALQQMCQGILDGIPGDEGVDEQLGDANRKEEE